MKKTISGRFLLLLAAVAFFLACSDDDNKGEGKDSIYNGYYSNKFMGGQEAVGDLELTYSGNFQTDREVRFQLETKTTAKLVLSNVLPGESETLIGNVALTKDGDGYKFGGNHTSGSGAAFTFAGAIGVKGNKRVMSLDITGVELASNILSGKSFKPVEKRNQRIQVVMDPTNRYQENDIFIGNNFVLDWTYKADDGEIKGVIENIEMVGSLLYGVLENLINNFVMVAVDEVQFNTDGNITANYSTMDHLELMEIMLIQGDYASYRAELQQSHKNLVDYYFTGENSLVIRPNLMSIIALVQANQARTRADMDLSEIMTLLPDILRIYTNLQRWTTDGIKFTLEKEKEDYTDDFESGVWHFIDHYYYDADYVLVIDKDELLSILTIIPKIWDLLGLELGTVEIDAMGMQLSLDLDSVIDSLMVMIPKTEELKVGLYLQAI